MGHQADVRAMLAAVQSLNGVQVSLVRGLMQTDEVDAIIGETVSAIDDGTGAVTEARSRDFIIRKSDYEFGGVTYHPAPDDFIIDSVSGEDLTYQVLPFFGDEQKRWSDPYGEYWRVHTKLTTYTAPAIAEGYTFDNAGTTFDATDVTFDSDG